MGLQNQQQREEIRSRYREQLGLHRVDLGEQHFQIEKVRIWRRLQQLDA